MTVTPYHNTIAIKGLKIRRQKSLKGKKNHYLLSIFSLCIPVSFAWSQQNRGVMVIPKKCKFLQLCEHQIGVQLTLLSCIFTPKWCKSDDLHTILNVFKNTFNLQCYSNTDLECIFSILVFSNTKIGLT